MMGGAKAPRAGLNVFVLLYSAALLASIAEGFFLVLPLYAKHVGGNELDVGWILWGGALGSVLFVGATSRLLEFVRPSTLAAAGCAAYACGAAIFAFSGHIGWYSYLAGFFQGAGVGLSVTSYPIVIQALIDDKSRSVHFSVLAAFGIAGMGVSPVIANVLTRNGITFNEMFLASAVMSLACIGMFAIVNRMVCVGGHAAARIPSRDALASVLTSEAIFPLSMVFLGACMFSSMMNFQTTFAVSKGLDFQVFYVFYIAATIVSRFALSHAVNRANPYIMTALLLAVMCASLASFAFVGKSAVLYALSSTLLGSSYGLVYPLLQAHAVNLTVPHLRDRVLAYFSFSYFVAVFGFPLVSGWVIVRYGYDAFVLVLLAVAAIELGIAIAHWRINVRGRATATVLSLSR